jgi:hypothetical protein
MKGDAGVKLACVNQFSFSLQYCLISIWTPFGLINISVFLASMAS